MKGWRHAAEAAPITIALEAMEMDPLTTAVASAVTRFLVDGASKVAEQLGEHAAKAAQTLAQKVLDRLGSDPAETRTVDRYKASPELMQPSIEAALADLVAADRGFAAQLQALLDEFDPNANAGASVVIHGDVAGPVQAGDHNVQIGTSTGDVTLNR